MYDMLLTAYTSLTWVVPFFVVLTILVFFHELGHYLSARRHGVKITTFSIGFGPEIFGFTDKVGTRWKFSMIPLGGYVKMFGDADASSKPDSKMQEKLSQEELQHTLNSKKIWQRIEVSLAGPLANILLTAIFLVVVFWQVGQTTFDSILGDIKPQGAAAKAGLKCQDKILSIDGQSIQKFRQIKTIVSKNPDKPLVFKVQRQSNLGAEILTLSVTPDKLTISPTKILGIINAEPTLIPHTFLSAVKSGFQVTYSLSIEMLGMFGKLITGQEDRSQLGSLFSIAKMSHDMWEGGIFSLLMFMALLSLNLGVINLLPIPMLDGGHIFLYLIEAIRGKPLSVKIQELAFNIGFGVVGFVMLYTLWNDLNRFSLWLYVIGFSALAATIWGCMERHTVKHSAFGLKVLGLFKKLMGK